MFSLLIISVDEFLITPHTTPFKFQKIFEPPKQIEKLKAVRLRSPQVTTALYDPVRRIQNSCFRNRAYVLYCTDF